MFRKWPLQMQMSTIAHLKNLLHLRSWSTFKNKNFKNDFFSWSDFCYWTKVRIKYVFNKSKAFKRNTSLFCFVTFFRANVFQVKLDKISFPFKFKLASHKLSDNQIPSALFTKLKKKRKVNTWNIRSSHAEVFYKIGFMTL